LRNALNVRSALALARFVREKQIEIVHAHMARDYPLAALATGRSEAQLVLTRHVLFALNPIHKLTLRRTARVIAVSEAVADSLRTRNIFPPERITTIHNGIDIERFAAGRKPAATGSAQDQFRVGMVGHLAQIKGQEDFVRAAALVCKERDDVQFIIAGEDKSSSGENRATIENLIRELGLDRQIQLPGWVPNVAQFLPTLDVFVSPARSEPFGLSIVEAMAAGVPVVSTESEGAAEILDDSQTGLLVPIGDVESIAGAIIALLDNKAERDRLATNAARVARERFSLKQMVDRTEEVYREILISQAKA
jgi:glycosyltransferase involved in cell wall biosynthesis